MSLLPYSTPPTPPAPLDNGAPSRKGRIINSQTTKESNKRVRPSPPRSPPLDGLVLQLRIELGCVEVCHERGGEHRHQDQGQRVELRRAPEERPSVLREPREEASTFDVAVTEG